MPIISTVGLFSFDKFEGTPNDKVFNISFQMSKLTKPYFKGKFKRKKRPKEDIESIYGLFSETNLTSYRNVYNEYIEKLTKLEKINKEAKCLPPEGVRT